MAIGRTLGLLALLTGAAALGGAACGNASLQVFNPTTPTPACYAKTPPSCTFSGDVMGVIGAPDPAHPSTACYEGGCHSGGSPAGQLTLGPPNASPPSVVWALLLGSGGTTQRANNGRDVYVSTTASVVAQSLILLKPDQDQPTTSHTGCKCWGETSDQYKIIFSWIMSGAQNN